MFSSLKNRFDLARCLVPLLLLKRAGGTTWSFHGFVLLPFSGAPKEHYTSPVLPEVDKKAFGALLENFFRKVEEKQIVHTTIFSASEARFLAITRKLNADTLTFARAICYLVL